MLFITNPSVPPSPQTRRLRRRRPLPPIASASRASPAPTTRYRARISYDGTNYSGWQFQPRQKTIQGALEAQLTQKLNGALVRVVGASRTDTGVHARGQMAHFDLPSRAALRGEEEVARFEFTMNRMLPLDVRMFDVEPAPEGEGGREFNAIFDAKGKLYSYRVCVGKTMDPLERLYRYHEWRCEGDGFDVAAAAEAAGVFEGTHDFTAFTNAGPKPRGGLVAAVVKNPVRTVRSVRVVDEGEGNLRFDFVLEGALYRMVRNMVGGILEVGTGRLDVEGLHGMLGGKERRLAPKGAPAHGLCLETVMYDV